MQGVGNDSSPTTTTQDVLITAKTSDIKMKPNDWSVDMLQDGPYHLKSDCHSNSLPYTKKLKIDESNAVNLMPLSIPNHPGSISARESDLSESASKAVNNNVTSSDRELYSNKCKSSAFPASDGMNQSIDADEIPEAHLNDPCILRYY
jgi:hypothetical protein